jgi:anti-sigma regulatory factor (Ser/Thr protein kinase)
MKRLRMPAVLDNLEEMLDFIVKYLNELISDKKLANQVRLSCEEVLVNVISYAYPDAVGDVEIICDIPTGNGDIFIRFIDEGVAYNPLLNHDPDIEAPIEDRGIGGLGVYLYKIIMDKVAYERKDEKNVLTFVKHFNKL